MSPMPRSLLPWRQMAELLTKEVRFCDSSEMVSLAGSTGRVLAKPLLAASPLPAFTHAVMDGFALGSLPPGPFCLVAPPCEHLANGEATVVTAGSRVPTGTVSVVLADHGVQVDHQLTVREAGAKDNIRREGEEARPGDVLLSAGTKLDARGMTLAAAAGLTQIAVCCRPRIACVGLHAGSHAFAHLSILHAMVESPPLRLTDAGTIRPAMLKAVLERLAPSHDLIIVVAESLGAEQGILFSAIENLGGEATVQRAALKPAKPVISGRLGPARIIGLAGTAYATTIAAHLFLRPMVQKLSGLLVDDPFVPAFASFARSREPGRAEALPVRLDMSQGRLDLTLAGRFGQLRALAEMHGFALIPAEAGALHTGMPVAFRTLSFPLI